MQLATRNSQLAQPGVIMKAKVKEREGDLLEYRPKYRTYRLLMRKRINEILLVSSIYDSFIIEEDVRLSDQIYEEFHNLNLRTLPRISRASSVSRALALLSKKKFDLVITMRRIGEDIPWEFAGKVKEIYDIPVVLLLNSPIEFQSLQTEKVQNTNIDQIFVWNGSSSVFVAIIKLLEDQMNVDNDTKTGDVRVIIVVEDSIQFNSLYLPVLYTEIMRQTHRLILDSGNDYYSLLQMRSRPKVLLASNYEEAVNYYQQYKDYLMGVITDIKFPKGGIITEDAGLDLARLIRQETPTLPLMLQSNNEADRKRAENLRGYFVNKNSGSLMHELRSFMMDFMGFGAFTFRLPNDEVVGVANNPFELQEIIKRAPQQSLIYHARYDHFSGWMSARGAFEVARQLKPRKVSEFEDGEGLRQMLVSLVDKLLRERLGTIIDFDPDSYYPGYRFVRLRPGSLGGKGRGIAFLLFLENSYLSGFEEDFSNITIQIPKTTVIGTDEFEEFMQRNHLYDIAFSGASDKAIKERFVKAQISASLWSDLKFIFESTTVPLAVRSSNIFEDSFYQPFAGVFATYMIPNCSPNVDERIKQLVTAIKLVYASTYLELARSYTETMGMPLAESRMAVVIQEVVGRQYEDRYYPDFSGIAASYNYYPLGDRLQPEDRIAHLVLGLGKMVVEGGLTRRFSPKRPKINLYSEPEQLIKESQRDFYAIRLSEKEIDIEKGEDTFLSLYGLRTAIQDGTLAEIADTYRPSDGTFSSGFWNNQTGYPVITFDRQLKYGTFPVAQIINRVLLLGEKAMGCPIEIEFASNLASGDERKSTFYLLQIRPFLEYESDLQEEVEVRPEDLFVFSTEISGNCVIKNIQDIVYVKPEAFDKSKTLSMVEEIGKINKKLTGEKKPYILIGPGRWGTGDRHLGIPVNWATISGARVIMEVDLDDFIVAPSQGSHFFHNIISAGIPYICIKHKSSTDHIDWQWLENVNAVEETTFFRHVRTTSPLLVVVNGKKRRGRIIKPTEL